MHVEAVTQQDVPYERLSLPRAFVLVYGTRVSDALQGKERVSPRSRCFGPSDTISQSEQSLVM